MSDSKRYSGYFSTPLLWEGELNGIKQLDLPVIKETCYTKEIEKKLRLGHLVEYYVEHEFDSHDEIEIMAKNLQINDDSRTLGEFDFIIYNKGQLQQIEVVYKFYLRDKSLSSDPIKQWIGPNRNDSLMQKLNKISNAQFPVLSTTEAIKTLHSLGINTDDIEQRVYFKAELYTSVDDKEQISPLNEAALAGRYYSIDQLQQFVDSKFYIPVKHDWLIKPHVDVSWMTYENSNQTFKELIETEKSALFWRKDKRGNLSKGFLVCW